MTISAQLPFCCRKTVMAFGGCKRGLIWDYCEEILSLEYKNKNVDKNVDKKSRNWLKELNTIRKMLIGRK